MTRKLLNNLLAPSAPHNRPENRWQTYPRNERPIDTLRNNWAVRNHEPLPSPDSKVYNVDPDTLALIAASLIASTPENKRTYQAMLMRAYNLCVAARRFLDERIALEDNDRELPDDPSLDALARADCYGAENVVRTPEEHTAWLWEAECRKNPSLRIPNYSTAEYRAAWERRRKALDDHWNGKRPDDEGTHAK